MNIFARPIAPIYGIENETLAYLSLANGGGLTKAQIVAIDSNIRLIKYSTGITLASITAKVSIADKFITQSSVDLRPYALIPESQFSLSDGTKSIVYSGAMTAGSGETLDKEVIPNNLFTDNITGWAVASSATIAWVAGELELTITGVGGGFTQTITGLTTGALYKRSTTARSGTFTAAMSFTDIGGLTAFGPAFTPVATEGTYSQYITTIGTSDVFTIKRLTPLTGTGYYNSVSEKRVLTPDTTGFSSGTVTDAGVDPNIVSWAVTITKP